MKEKKITVHKHIPHAERVKFAVNFDQEQQLHINQKLHGEKAAKIIAQMSGTANSRIFAGEIPKKRNTSRMLQDTLDALSKKARQPLAQTTSSHVRRVDWVEYTKILNDPEFIPVTSYLDRLRRPLIQQEKGIYRGRLICLYKINDNTL